MKNLPISSIQSSKKTGKLLLILSLLLVGSVLLNLCFGAAVISPRTTLLVLLGRETGTTAAHIILLARLPRTFGCVLAGMALAAAGVLLQNVLLNPMASPSVIGVNAGAGLAVALSSALAASSIPALGSSFCAFLGALAAVLLVLFISERNGASRMTLILAGVAVSSILNAGTDAVITFVPDAINGYTGFRIGGLENLSMGRLLPAAAIIGTAFLLAVSMCNELEILSLGTETAQSLGLSAKTVRLFFLSLAAALSGASVSFAGSLGFIGLIVPHIMRRIAGNDCRTLLLSSALGGALFLSLCDLLSRMLFAPFELPVGITLSFLGGPFFLWLLFRQKGGRTHD